MFNSSPLHSKINNVSRMNLFFNPGKYQSPNLYNINENENILQSLKQQKALVKIHEFRNKFRSYYKEFKNPFIMEFGLTTLETTYKYTKNVVMHAEMHMNTYDCTRMYMYIHNSRVYTHTRM